MAKIQLIFKIEDDFICRKCGTLVKLNNKDKYTIFIQRRCIKECRLCGEIKQAQYGNKGTLKQKDIFHQTVWKADAESHTKVIRGIAPIESYKKKRIKGDSQNGNH